MELWFKANKLTINMSKTKYSIFAKNQGVPNNLNCINVNGAKIDRVSDSKYLGMILDDQISWKKHIEELNEKLTKTIQAFKIVTRYLNTSTKYMIYYAYFYSRVHYGSELFTTSNKTCLNSVQVKQNRALKVLFHKDFYTPTLQLHKDLKVPLIRDIGKINSLKLVHKIQNKLAPDAFNGYFVQNKDVPGRRKGTRQDNLLSTNQYKGNILRQTFKFRGASLWNDTPKEIQNMEKNYNFGRHLKAHIISKY